MGITDSVLSYMKKNMKRFLAFTLSILLFATLVVHDQPMVYMDDVFYSGAALEMAQGGEFSNPTLRMQEFPSDKFLVYPPYYSYVLAGWLTILGVSKITMLSFACVAGLMLVFASSYSLIRLAAPHWVVYPLCLVISVAPLQCGLRTETLGLLFFMIGMASFAGIRSANYFIGSLFYVASVLTNPRLVIFVCIYVAVYFGYHLLVRRNRQLLMTWKSVVYAISGACVATLLFLVMIDFELPKFLENMACHMSRLTIGWDVTCRHFAMTFWDDRYAMVLRLPYLLFVVSLSALNVFLVRDDADNMPQEPFLLVVVALMSGLVASYTVGLFFYHVNMFFLAYVCVVLATRCCMSKRLICKGVSVCFAIFLLFTFLMSLKYSLNQASAMTAKPFLFAVNQEREISQAELSEMAQKKIVVGDVFAARYLFDYRLPKGFVNWEFSAKFPEGALKRLDQRKCDHVWVISKKSEEAHDYPMFDEFESARLRVFPYVDNRHVFYVVY